MVATYLCRSLPRLHVMFILQFITPWRCFANSFVVGRSCFRAYCCSQVLCFNSLLCPDVLFSSILFRTFCFQIFPVRFGVCHAVLVSNVHYPRRVLFLDCFVGCHRHFVFVCVLSCVYSCTSCGVAGNWRVMCMVVR